MVSGISIQFFPKKLKQFWQNQTCRILFSIWQVLKICFSILTIKTLMNIKILLTRACFCTLGKTSWFRFLSPGRSKSMSSQKTDIFRVPFACFRKMVSKHLSAPNNSLLHIYCPTSQLQIIYSLNLRLSSMCHWFSHLPSFLRLIYTTLTNISITWAVS